MTKRWGMTTRIIANGATLLAGPAAADVVFLVVVDAALSSANIVRCSLGWLKEHEDGRQIRCCCRLLLMMMVLCLHRRIRIHNSFENGLGPGLTVHPTFTDHLPHTWLFPVSLCARCLLSSLLTPALYRNFIRISTPAWIATFTSSPLRRLLGSNSLKNFNHLSLQPEEKKNATSMSTSRVYA